MLRGFLLRSLFGNHNPGGLRRVRRVRRASIPGGLPAVVPTF